MCVPCALPANMQANAIQPIHVIGAFCLVHDLQKVEIRTKEWVVVHEEVGEEPNRLGIWGGKANNASNPICKILHLCCIMRSPPKIVNLQDIPNRIGAVLCSMSPRISALISITTS